MSSVTHPTTLRPGCWQARAPYWGLWEECVPASLWCWLNSVPKVVGLGSHFPLTSNGAALCSYRHGAPLLAFFHISPPAVAGCLPLLPQTSLLCLLQHLCTGKRAGRSSLLFPRTHWVPLDSPGYSPCFEVCNPYCISKTPLPCSLFTDPRD